MWSNKNLFLCAFALNWIKMCEWGREAKRHDMSHKCEKENSRTGKITESIIIKNL